MVDLDKLSKAYRTERLIFRVMEETEEDKAVIHDMYSDPLITAMATGMLLRGGSSMADVAEFLKMTSKSPLSVFICLPPAPPTETTAEEGKSAVNGDDKGVNGKDDAKKDDKDAKPKKPKPTPIGFVGLFHPGGGPERSFSQHRTAMLGISLHQDHRDKGYGREAINWALDWAFEKAGLHRVSLVAWSYNPRGLHLYKSVGFVEEGRDRETLFLDRKWHDAVRFGILESEWERMRGLRAD